MRAFGWLTWLAGPRKHRELSRQRRDLQRQLQLMTKTIDDFAQLLGPRNWVFHSKLPVDEMATLVRDADPERAERQFIEFHRTNEWLPFWVQRSGEYLT